MPALANLPKNSPHLPFFDFDIFSWEGVTLVIVEASFLGFPNIIFVKSEGILQETGNGSCENR
jgi:hypothetical protein